MELNFKNLPYFPYKQKEALKSLHLPFAKQIAESLSLLSHLQISADLESIEQMPYSKYLLTVVNPTCLTKFEILPFSHDGLFEVNSTIAYMISNKMLGGTGEISSFTHSLSNLEIAITRKFINLLLKRLSETWRRLLDVTFSIDQIYTDKTQAKNIPSYQPCVVIRFMIKIHMVKGLISIIFPSSSLYPLIQELEKSQRHLPAHTSRLKIPLLDIELVARLGDLYLSQIDFQNLQPGDVLILNQETKNSIKVLIENEPVFEAKPGLIGQYKGVAL